VALKLGSEIDRSSTNDSGNADKLEAYPSIEQYRPFNADLQPRSREDFVERFQVLGNYQETASAQIDRTARARKKKPAGKYAEPNAELEWITRLQPPFRGIGRIDKCCAALFFADCADPARRGY
jgi:hypothetical protein